MRGRNSGAVAIFIGALLIVIFAVGLAVDGNPWHGLGMDAPPALPSVTPPGRPLCVTTVRNCRDEYQGAGEGTRACSHSALSHRQPQKNHNKKIHKATKPTLTASDPPIRPQWPLLSP